MTTGQDIEKTLIKDVDLQCAANNFLHHTSEISMARLIVRRGQPFTISVKLREAFTGSEPFLIAISTGQGGTQELGTKCFVSYPDGVERSPEAKKVWKLDLGEKSSLKKGDLVLNLAPPADAPVGQYKLVAKYKEEERELATLTVIFNPWCSDDLVFMSDTEKRQEYVMNEHGIIFKGSHRYIFEEEWDFAQFEEEMVDICVTMLDVSHKHEKDPVKDVANRWDPVYIGRLISAMINSEDDCGVLEGRWGGPYDDGWRPTHWTGSFAILNKWLESDCHPVKYGQCWVFAAVMCSVMRFWGIPCRVVTNFASAHDCDGNLTIDEFVNEDGELIYADDSIWNFHVWTEGWMKRPDLTRRDEKVDYDGWQVLDPTPQELSGGVYCCGPTPVTAIFHGHTEVKYDCPFVLAEVNADRVKWEILEDGSLEKVESDTEVVGQKISTKAVGSSERVDLTNTYKHEEGTKKERVAFKRAVTGLEDLKKLREEEKKRRLAEEGGTEGAETTGAVTEGAETTGGAGTTGAVTEGAETTGGAGTTGAVTEGAETAGGATTTTISNGTDTSVSVRETTNVTVILEEAPEICIPPPPPKVNVSIKEVKKPENGKDVCLNLTLSSKIDKNRPLVVKICIQSMGYNGHPVGKIRTEKKEVMLQPGKDLCIPITVPFSEYCTPMLNCDSMKVTALVKDKERRDHPYMAENDIVLVNPPIEVKILGECKLNTPVDVEIVFENPLTETLKNCSVTISGSGLWKGGEHQVKIGDFKANRRLRLKTIIVPYKKGNKTLMADFDCSILKDIKGYCTVKVKA